LTEQHGADDGSDGIFIRLTAEQVRDLPAGVRRAVGQLVAELRAAGTVVPATGPLSRIADEIEHLLGPSGAVEEAASARSGADLRAALQRRADELRIRDVLPTLEWPPGGSCGTVTKVVWAAVDEETVVILPRSPRTDDPASQ
jgi:hypothetical protein